MSDQLTIHGGASLAAIAHLIDNSGLSHAVVLDLDNGRCVARFVYPRMSDGQRALWCVLGWFAGADESLLSNATDPHVDETSRRAIEDALALAFGRDAA